MLQLVACVHRDVKDKVVVITGASSGFGKGVAQKLAAQGAKSSWRLAVQSCLKILFGRTGIMPLR